MYMTGQDILQLLQYLYFIVKFFLLLMSISLMSLFSEIIKSDETNWELQVDYLFNQKRKPSKQKLNW